MVVSLAATFGGGSQMFLAHRSGCILFNERGTKKPTNRVDQPALQGRVDDRTRTGDSQIHNLEL